MAGSLWKFSIDTKLLYLPKLILSGALQYEKIDNMDDIDNSNFS